MAQYVKHPILDFGSSNDLRVVGSSPTLGSPLQQEACVGFSLSPSPFPSVTLRPFSLPPPHSELALSKILK